MLRRSACFSQRRSWRYGLVFSSGAVLLQGICLLSTIFAVEVSGLKALGPLMLLQLQDGWCVFKS